MKRLIVFLLLICIIYPAASYPISPRPLRKLVMEAEYVIVGQVVEIVLNTNRKGFYTDSYAKIRIVQVLQGEIKEDFVKVSVDPGVVCPAPARYKANTYVLAFLGNSEKGFYTTHARSYGAKTLSLTDIEVYKQRIIEMQLILKVNNQDDQFIQTVEWLVRCAEAPATRWEGTFELSPESDFMSHYSTSERGAFRYMLSNEQKLRLKDALFASETLGYQELGLVDLVYSENENEVCDFLVRKLKSLNEEEAWAAGMYMERILYSKQDPRLEALFKEYESIQFESEKENERKQIVNNFLSLASL